MVLILEGLNLLHALLYGDREGLVDKYHEGAVASEVAALIHYGTTVKHVQLFCLTILNKSN